MTPAEAAASAAGASLGEIAGALDVAKTTVRRALVAAAAAPAA